MVVHGEPSYSQFGLGKEIMPTQSNRRHEKRKAKRLTLTGRALLKREGTNFSGEIINISDNGAYVATNAPCSVNDPIILVLDFQHGGASLTMTFPCQVVRVDGRGIGLISPHMDAIMLSRLELVFDINKENSKLLIEEFCKAL